MNNNLGADEFESGNPEYLAQLLKLEQRFVMRVDRQRYVGAGEEKRLDTGRVAVLNMRPVVVVELNFPDWLHEDLYDVSAVILTTAIVDGRLASEAVFAGIERVEDLDESGDRIRLEITPMFGEAPMLARWPDATFPVVDGVFSLETLAGEARAVLGISVYLGKLNNPPTTLSR